MLEKEASRPPSGVITFLFTDIEGSTRRWEVDAKAMRAALAVHDEVLRRVIEAHGGHLFNHTGDGVCAAFASPSSAVDAAVEAQLALELPVRMGIATGEAEAAQGDYFGPVLNRAARVMAAGHGGQILLDGATASMLSGFDLAELGSRRLRDIAKPVEMFQVRTAGLRTEFPPLKTLDATSGNLKPQMTSFVGRDAELDQIQAAIKAYRLVTLTGVGGVGKTRLALEVASRVLTDFRDGVFVIELAPVGDPGAVPEAVAAALGITQQPGLSIAESVAAALEGRSRLLVFDNCEHVLDAAANMIETIFARSTTVKVLATSREGLRLSHEQLWPVPSLDTIAGADSAAAALFMDRAQTLSPGVLMSSPDESASVVEICRRLDGIPLAIELAASRMVSMTAVEVRDRLGDRFRLLVGSRRGLERHQTLRHAVQWSYDLLDDTEKALLTTCSVFAGGFDLAGACAVADSADDLATLDLLDALVRKSLLVADRSSGRTRFTMLDTIRQFSEEQLVASGGGDIARTAHARYFAGCEADVMALWDSPHQREAYEWFTVELSNLRTAFRWSADHEDLDSATAIAIYTTFLGLWVEQYESSTWAEELIEAARAAQHHRLAQIYAMATLRPAWTGRMDVAVGYLDALLAVTESGRFDTVPFEADAYLGGAYISTGDPKRWVELCRNIIARAEGTHSLARTCLAIALMRAGARDEAAACSQSLLAAADATDNPHVRSTSLLGYGVAHRDDDPASAYDALRRGLTIAQDSGNRHMESSLAVSLSRLAATHGVPAEAFDFITLTIRHYQESGYFWLMPNPLAILAALFDRLGRHEPAATISGFAATPLASTGLPEFDGTIAHLREVCGDRAYESFARAGANMTNAAMVTYAFEQMDLARADLPHVDESP